MITESLADTMLVKKISPTLFCKSRTSEQVLLFALCCLSRNSESE